ncbi:MAG: DUF4215 domain-containing protein [Sandaracinus sp.]|nr:DUF4215 domain-containing protein [Sandaracinus sp.]
MKISWKVLALSLGAIGSWASAASAQCDGGAPNGNQAVTEACDDGNATAGDGCSPTCTIETGWGCRLPLDFRALSIESYPGANATWTLGSDGRSGIQTSNTAHGTLGLFNADAFATTYTVDIRVATTNDDDFIGFVLGFNPGDTTNAMADYLLVDWKQLNQNIGGGTARIGLALSRVRGIPTANNLWLHDGAVTEVARAATLGTTGWADNTTYRFEITHTPSLLVVRVNGVEQFRQAAPAGGWPAGEIGFYGLSQDQVRYTIVAPLASVCSPVCGDSLLRGTESCDDGDATAGDGCSDTCRVEPGYTCTGLPSVCTTRCGDGAVSGAEACDDGNTANGDGCSSTCVVESGYTCADLDVANGSFEEGDGGGNLTSLPGWTVDAGDVDHSTAYPDTHGTWSIDLTGCTAGTISQVVSTTAGTRYVVTVDHGSNTVTNSFALSAQNASSGAVLATSTFSSPAVVGADTALPRTDSIAFVATSASTRLVLRTVTSNAACTGNWIDFVRGSSACVEVCGDGVVTPGEACDDGGVASGDGCSATCTVETGWACMGAPSSCDGVCGDGSIRGTERCDDGNVAPGDGCNATCRAEVVITAPSDGALTNDATPTISGTADPGATVMVSVGAEMGSVVADGTGAWTFTPASPVGDGAVVVSATAVDGRGGSSSAMISITVDTAISVAITEPVTGSSSTDTTPTITGTGEPGAMVTVVLDGMTLDIVTVGMDGTWSVMVGTALAEGVHTVIATAMDAAGNTAMDTSIFTVDTSTSVAIVTPADGTRVMTGTPTISGTAEPGAMVTVSVDGTELGTVTADGSGNWSIDVTTALTEGPHSASASATDTLGNTASTESDFTVDLGTTVSFEQPSVTGDETPELSGTGEPGASVEVSVDGSVVGTVIVDAEGNWTLVVGPLTDGTHDVSVTATDDAGNTANDTGSFLVDLDSPAVEIANPGDGTTTSDNTPTITGTATPGASVLVIVDGSILGIASADATGAWSIDVTTALADGEHEVVATVTDADGDTVEDAHVFTVDTADAPAIAITSPTGGAVTSDATPTITGTATAGVTVDVYVDGVFVGTVTADGDGNWSLDVGTALSDGSHTVRAVATDGDGNTATDGGTFTVDTETEVAIVAPAEGATVGGPRPTISGSAEAGASVVVSVDGTEIGTVVAGADGTWSVRVTFDLTDGDHDASATATDEVGNTATDSVDFTVGGLDTDGDGFLDTEECPSMPCRDTDMDGNPDFDDPDDDGDGIPTAVECPGATSCRDSDSDTTPDYLDPDDDDDGILTRDEGSGSRDTDSDGIPDHLDVDDDGDGLLTEDECATMPCRDTDTDGTPDFLDPDDDGDAIPTTREREDGATHGNDVDMDGNDNWLDTDSDAADGSDSEEGVGDSDMDGIPDYLDPANPVMPDGGVDGGTGDAGVSDGGVPDAGMNDDAGASDGGAEADAGTAPSGGGFSGGALCTATGGSDPSAAVGLALVGLALLRRRRRR